MPTFKERIEAEFWKRCVKAGPDECWNWVGRTGKGTVDKGRAVFVVEGLGWAASRIAWSLANDADPGKMHVLHSCDNGLCVNPNHLRLGTNGENILDKVSRGRVPRGEKTGNAKVTDAQMTEILHRYVAGEEPDNLGKEFGISATTVREVTRRVKWKHIAPEITDEMLDEARFRQELRRRERSGLAPKVSKWAREEICRHRLLGGMSLSEVGRLYGVATSTAMRICPGRIVKPGPKRR